MIYLLVVIHIIVCLFLIGVVLLQQGKSADLAGAFGGQGSQTAFGPRGAANLLTKLTTWGAIIAPIVPIIRFSPERPPSRPRRRSKSNQSCTRLPAMRLHRLRIFRARR
jgi:preprotein translocase subunit SecG